MCDENMREAIRGIISHIGDDPTRDGVVGTPDRVVRSWKELFGGYVEDPAIHLAKQFDTTSSQMVHINGIGFFSMCEHHMLPFYGTVDIAYLPTKKVVGLSKFARLVDGYARRLQIQERLTGEIADAIWANVDTLGVAVRVRAQHLCMLARGVKSPGTSMTTTALHGRFTESIVRTEWFQSLD